MSIGLIIMNVAFTALHFTRKFVRKGEVIGAKNDAMQSMMLWCLTQDNPDTTYPVGPQFRMMGGKLTLMTGSLDKTGATRIFYKAEARQYYNSQQEAPSGSVKEPAPVDKYYSVAGTLYFAKKD